MEEQLLQVDQGGLVVVVVVMVTIMMGFALGGGGGGSDVVVMVVVVISCKYIPQDCHHYSAQKVASQSRTAFVVVEQYQHQDGTYLKQNAKRVGDRDGDGHDKHQVVDDEHLVRVDTTLRAASL